MTDIIRHHKNVENKKCHQQILFAHFLMFFSRLFCLRVFLSATWRINRNNPNQQLRTENKE